ncbi:hypothetical protein FPZ12_043415 [Amycolatopsis acidicola]|uniref:Neutral/alkaline non-lysosomal ceramidase N-terminal domain-containing protein n=1 Tax=Amycolatopsis acidicola TaxID=2596893 RepID=A0A5N0UJJ9_9PSEU|nr:hypothetical protein [Amycolatopsis acidicola]KAA9149418.1 hypothetical protein FPZ12_043415 [Amycolatopsis acidicola]
MSSSIENGHSKGFARRSFLAASAAAALASSALTGTAAAAGADAKNGLTAGAGKAAIAIPPELLPLDGFTTVHDDLYVRVLVLTSGATRAALVVLDLTSISAEAIAQIRQVVTKTAGVAATDIIVTVTHTFSAPHVLASTSSPGAATWVQNIVAAATSAAADAVKSARPARVGYGVGSADVNVNRNVETSAGWWLGTGEALPSDKSVNVARFDDLGGRPIAILVNYNVQSSVMMESVMAGGDLPITADLAGATVAHLEQQYDDVTGFFLVGACGDQAPGFRSKRYTIDKAGNWSQTDARDAGWLLLTVQGERLGTEAVRVSETIKTSTARTLKLVTDSVTVDAVVGGHPTAPTTSYTFVPAGTTQAPLWVLQVGEGAFAGAAPELSTSTALTIKKKSPLKYTFVLSMLEGGAKNMADRWNYQHLTYEAIDSSYAEGAAEALADRFGRVLNSLSK